VYSYSVHTHTHTHTQRERERERERESVCVTESERERWHQLVLYDLVAHECIRVHRASSTPSVSKTRVYLAPNPACTDSNHSQIEVGPVYGVIVGVVVAASCFDTRLARNSASLEDMLPAHNPRTRDNSIDPPQST
jgi:hypothetical protein